VRIFFHLAFIAFVFFSGPSSFANNTDKNYQSKEYDGIVAIVNGDIITSHDLEKRMLLTLFSTGIETNDELKSKIFREVLREMIQEKLKWQCAQKYAPKNGWITNEAVESAFSDIAKRNNLSYDDFCKLLKSKNIDKDELLKQIRINLSWIGYINARFGRLINVSESEIHRTLAEVKEKHNMASYYIRRMFFPVGNISHEKETLAQVNNLKQMLLKGVNFGNLARQFSKSPDASKGGEIGWVLHGQLSPEENLELSKMQIGNYSIVKNNRGYIILFLHDKKEAGLKHFTTVKFVQIVIPFGEPNPGNEQINQIKNYLHDMKKNSKNCHEFIKSAKDSGFCAISDPATLTLEEMQPQFRSMLASLQIGGIGDPIMTPNGIVMICMLDRQTQQIPEPTADDIRAQKTNERLSIFADREIQGLKKKSEIQINEKYGSLFDFL
jgi:peptidyl-prolyl cis-trans isomerase SurA